jgi:hypothetical protein
MKTNTDRIKRIAELAEAHYGIGEIRAVSIKYVPFEKQWIAKIRL